MVSDFYDHPDLYDALLPVGAHLPFYAGLARQQNGPVLELACGTGQLTVPIALQGLPTAGLDQSRAMLAVATARAAAANASIDFVRGDLRNFALGRDFSFIFLPRNSLLHLLTTEDLLARTMYDRAMAAWWKDGPVPSLEERVAYLEGRTEEHAAAMGEVCSDIRELRAEMIHRFEHVDRRFEQIDGRLNHVDSRFTWLMGLQFATLLAVIGALLGTAR